MRRWFGLKGPWSTCVIGTDPVVNGRVVPFEVWLSPSAAPWDYAPGDDDGPFRLLRTDPHGVMYGYRESADLVEVVELFSRFHQPRWDEACVVLDRHANMLLGWSYVSATQSTFWTGCQHAFALLGCYLPVDAAIWETMAYDGRAVMDLQEMFHHDIR